MIGWGVVFFFAIKTMYWSDQLSSPKSKVSKEQVEKKPKIDIRA